MELSARNQEVTAAPVAQIQGRDGRPPYEPNDEHRALVILGAENGMPHHDIARILRIGIHTLRRHYRRELRESLLRARLRAGGKLFKMGVEEGNVKALVHWLSMRGGEAWKPPAIDHHHSGPNGGVIPIAAAAVAITDDDAAKTYMALIREDI